MKLKTVTIDRNSAPFVIAEIGNNHMGNFEHAKEMVHTAKFCGADAVKFQRRNNKKLYAKELYNQVYDNPESFGKTYGEHREALELSDDELIALKDYCDALNLEFICTAFDYDSVDFLDSIGVSSFKIASGDLTSLPLIEYIAKKGKPIFISTGASTIAEVDRAYDLITQYTDELCIFQCTAAYPAEYNTLHLNVIKEYKQRYPKAIIGYSGHDSGILAPSLARILGATVFEKHFTLNRTWKGTDQKFSLEPRGLQLVVRDLKRVDMALGVHDKTLLDCEKKAKIKMGKGVYYTSQLPVGHVLCEEHLTIKSPANNVSASDLMCYVGKKLKVEVDEDQSLEKGHLE